MLLSPLNLRGGGVGVCEGFDMLFFDVGAALFTAQLRGRHRIGDGLSVIVGLLRVEWRRIANVKQNAQMAPERRGEAAERQEQKELYSHCFASLC